MSIHSSEPRFRGTRGVVSSGAACFEGVDRTPTDGKPYYCVMCGAGFAEFMACEMPDCQLESVESAGRRQEQAQDDAEPRLSCFLRPQA